MDEEKELEEDIEFIPMSIVDDKKQLSVRIPSKIVEALDINPELDAFLFMFNKDKLSLEGLLITKKDIKEFEEWIKKK